MTPSYDAHSGARHGCESDSPARSSSGPWQGWCPAGQPGNPRRPGAGRDPALSQAVPGRSPGGGNTTPDLVADSEPGHPPSAASWSGPKIQANLAQGRLAHQGDYRAAKLQPVPAPAGTTLW